MPCHHEAHPGGRLNGTWCDSLLLFLLQLMVPDLLVVQQHPSILQVPGEMVALPLQLVSRLLGLFIRTLQLPELWKEEGGNKRLTSALISKVIAV